MLDLAAREGGRRLEATLVDDLPALFDQVDRRLGLLLARQPADVDCAGEALEVAPLVLDPEPHQHLGEDARRLLGIVVGAQPDPQAAGRRLQVAVEGAGNEVGKGLGLAAILGDRRGRKGLQSNGLKRIAS